MADRCRPLKLEDLPSGGSSLDPCPTETNPHQDGLDAAALFLQAPSTADSTCYADRDPADGAWRLTDAVAGTRRNPDLVSQVRGATASHRALVDLMHFIDDGPADGWASGAVRVRVGTSPAPGGWVWWTSTSYTQRIVDVTYSYPAGSLLPSSKVWRLYARDGVTVAITLTDTLAWSGPVLLSTTRTWA